MSVRALAVEDQIGSSDSSAQRLRLSVLVPSYRRPRDLARCLEALSRQTRTPDEVLVVARADDFETLDQIQTWSAQISVRLIPVRRPGQVAALNAGVAAVTGDVVAITDDDAAPRRSSGR
jgi:glycosyltransferase involved in cell wall biosynthesis